MASEKMLVGRHKRVAFMDANGSGETFTRMTGFTSLSDGKNSTEYSRQYVDEASERSDVVGYAPAIVTNLTGIPMIRYMKRLQQLPMMRFSEQKHRLILWW